MLYKQPSAVVDADFTASTPYDLSTSFLPPPVSGVTGHYRHAGCTVPLAGKFAYVAYSPVTPPSNADVTCSDGDVMTCPAACSCDSGEMTSALSISGPTCLDIGDQLRYSVDFV